MVFLTYQEADLIVGSNVNHASEPSHDSHVDEEHLLVADVQISREQ